MRAQVSVVIPTLNTEPALADCLGALMEGLEQGVIRELIVSDGGSSDGSGAVAQAWGAEVIVGPASRGGQLARGVAVAKGDWVLVLHADTVLEAGWAQVVRAHLTQKDRAGWFRLAFDQKGIFPLWVATWANIRSRMGLPYGDQGLLIHRNLYQEVGGYPDQPLMEDVAIARRLRGKLVELDCVAVTSAIKYQRQGWLRRGAKNLWTLVRYAAGASPEKLAEAYRR
ncbi:TIGR04283 family arsenosugar biosynthesis glycosyltransferase [Sulfitobacter donghicola]|uniref:Glycosyl transferase n=1 Tax=Sulfitobacter donghicola DSW-25 = KCTC 12864 = JCM 14565 TaxID=1300350 RepID=A0A073II61_9RHOB|nr:TIGR04283 family arsenosugar biosynthesis glycosyltransferase [Sulfitobacter donghicola]KEJ89201.1 glycosyl transferase [Sulfitobacter donghicola DSW-25 = KCTC 12864 = JCM 14565]KIN68991.1 Glycosyl transferase, group 2 family protein [Sulfitobacter donghicola DSW-25 = KCTC 12864 = JCM 14565]